MDIALPSGFRFASAACGIKKNAAKEDIALIACDQPATAAGVYTTNIVYAAPVQWDRDRTPMADCRGVLINSGNANACTGQRGWEDAAEMARLAAEQLGCRPQQILVMSTGIIGKFLPMQRIAAGVAEAAGKLAANSDAFLAAARGILTTDQGTKTASREFASGGRTVRLAGMAKGAGMIGPQMATMLGVVLTDAPLTPLQADQLLREAADVSFNCISVEGHMSTNDTLVLLAPPPSDDAPAATSKDLAGFSAALKALCIELACQIPADGEGATHLIRIHVSGADTVEDARRIAKNVASSALVKTAVAGGDPNWGRIVSAAGYAGVAFDPEGLRLELNGHCIYEHGSPSDFDAASVSQALREHFETRIDIALQQGSAEAVFWTSDLTVDYVRFNSDYST